VGELPLAQLDHVPDTRKRGFDRTVLPHNGIAAGVVEMQVGVDNQCYVGGLESGLADRVLQSGGVALVLDAIDVEELLLFLVAGPCIDEHELRAGLDEQRPHGHGDAVPVVGGNLLLPKRLRHHPEHGTTVQALASGVQCMKAKRTQLPCLYPRHVTVPTSRTRPPRHLRL
jgi:hypothetical protein